MAASICWAAIVFALYSIPGHELTYEDPWRVIRFDKIAHMALFAVLVMMIMVGLRKQSSVMILRLHAKKSALLFSIVYGGVLEFYQTQLFVQRTSDIMDFAANTIGVFSGLVLFRLVYGRELSKW